MGSGLCSGAAELPDKIRIAGVVRESIVDGPGLRFVVFCQGCPHGCTGCHNEATHDFGGGYDCEIEKILAAIEKDPLLDGVTFSGGEPICQASAFYALAKKIRERFPALNIVMFTGYTYEELQPMAGQDEALAGLLELTDYLIDGRYEAEQRDLTLQFRGSTNQRILDMQATLKEGHAVLCEKYM